jgi:hypothetical protein
MIYDQIRQDILDWVIGYIEVDHKFYDYKFPPCPYARSARLKGLLDIQVHESGSATAFVESNVQQVIDTTYTVRVLVMPPRFKYNWFLKHYMKKLNARVVANDLYCQFGTALKTHSQYPGLFNQGPYCIVIINKLSDILNGHRALLKTDYYKPWAQHHYQAVVERRQHTLDNHNKVKNDNS